MKFDITFAEGLKAFNELGFKAADLSQSMNQLGASLATMHAFVRSVRYSRPGNSDFGYNFRKAVKEAVEEFQYEEAVRNAKPISYYTT